MEVKISKTSIKDFVKRLAHVSFNDAAIDMLQKEAISLLWDMSFTDVTKVMEQAIIKAAQDTGRQGLKSVPEQILTDAIDYACDHRSSPKKKSPSPNHGRGPKKGASMPP